MRRRLLEYMQVKKVVSAAELARAFKITAADARHHLASLEEDGVVQIIDTRVRGRGRPTQMYGLTIELDRNNLDALIKAVLSEWLGGVSSEETKEAALDRIATHFLDGYPPPEGNLTQRLNRAVRQLHDMHYQARWEAHITAPRLVITHCPYATVISEHPEICRIDELLFGKLLGIPVALISRLGKNEHGEVQCVFRVGIQ